MVIQDKSVVKFFIYTEEIAKITTHIYQQKQKTLSTEMSRLF